MSNHGVVRTDLMFSTDARSGLVTVEYMGSDGATPTDIDNGNVVLLDKLADGESEIFIGKDVEAGSVFNDVALIATPEVMYDERKRNLDEYVNEAGDVSRGYRLHNGDIFAVTKDALTGEETPAVGNVVELEAGTKLKISKAATEGSTTIGNILSVEKEGRYTYYTILVNSKSNSKGAVEPAKKTGASAVKVPDQAAQVEGKTVSEFIDADCEIQWSGTDGDVNGTINYIKEYSAFQGDEANGNFFPFTLDASYTGKPITVKRTSNGGGTEKTVSDLNWVLRLTDGKSTEFSISSEGTTIAKLSFENATLKTDGG